MADVNHRIAARRCAELPMSMAREAPGIYHDCKNVAAKPGEQRVPTTTARSWDR